MGQEQDRAFIKAINNNRKNRKANFSKARVGVATSIDREYNYAAKLTSTYDLVIVANNKLIDTDAPEISEIVFLNNDSLQAYNFHYWAGEATKAKKPEIVDDNDPNQIYQDLPKGSVRILPRSDAELEKAIHDIPDKISSEKELADHLAIAFRPFAIAEGSKYNNHNHEIISSRIMPSSKTTLNAYVHERQINYKSIRWEEWRNDPDYPAIREMVQNWYGETEEGRTSSVQKILEDSFKKFYAEDALKKDKVKKAGERLIALKNKGKLPFEDHHIWAELNFDMVFRHQYESFVLEELAVVILMWNKGIKVLYSGPMIPAFEYAIERLNLHDNFYEIGHKTVHPNPKDEEIFGHADINPAVKQRRDWSMDEPKYLDMTSNGSDALETKWETEPLSPLRNFSHFKPSPPTPRLTAAVTVQEKLSSSPPRDKLAILPKPKNKINKAVKAGMQIYGHMFDVNETVQGLYSPKLEEPSVHDGDQAVQESHPPLELVGYAY